MSKVFIKNYRSFVPHDKKTFGDADWANFEDMLRTCFQELNLDLKNDIDNITQSSGLVFCAHRTKRTEPEAHFFYKQMHLSYLFTIDTDGWGPTHSNIPKPEQYVNIHADNAIELCTQLSSEFLSSGNSKHKQPELTNTIPFPEDYILVPIQRPNDEMLQRNSPIGVTDFITLIGNWAEENKKNIVFKLHPGNYMDPGIAEHVEACTKGRKYLHLLEGNIHEFISKSSGVFCINSGTGFESLIHGKPVATFGNCDYKSATFSADDQNLDEALKYVTDYSNEQREMAFKLIFYYHNVHGFSIQKNDQSESRKRLMNYLEQALIHVEEESSTEA